MYVHPRIKYEHSAIFNVAECCMNAYICEMCKNNIFTVYLLSYIYVYIYIYVYVYIRFMFYILYNMYIACVRLLQMHAEAKKSKPFRVYVQRA